MFVKICVFQSFPAELGVTSNLSPPSSTVKLWKRVISSYFQISRCVFEERLLVTPLTYGDFVISTSITDRCYWRCFVLLSEKINTASDREVSKRTVWIRYYLKIMIGSAMILSDALFVLQCLIDRLRSFPSVFLSHTDVYNPTEMRLEIHRNIVILKRIWYQEFQTAQFRNTLHYSSILRTIGFWEMLI